MKASYQYVFELREKMEETLMIAHEGLLKSQKKGKHYYDGRESKERKFELGDRVLMLLPTDNNKLLMQRKGPYQVSAVVDLSDLQT